MRNLAWLFVILFVFSLLFGCGKKPADPEFGLVGTHTITKTSRFSVEDGAPPKFAYHIWILTDSTTGKEYLFVNGALTPVLK